jgi:hypothetical protein
LLLPLWLWPSSAPIDSIGVRARTASGEQRALIAAARGEDLRIVGAPLAAAVPV